jgi:hypothetical protein
MGQESARVIPYNRVVVIAEGEVKNCISATVVRYARIFDACG